MFLYAQVTWYIYIFSTRCNTAEIRSHLHSTITSDTNSKLLARLPSNNSEPRPAAVIMVVSVFLELLLNLDIFGDSPEFGSSVGSTSRYQKNKKAKKHLTLHGSAVCSKASQTYIFLTLMDRMDFFLCVCVVWHSSSYLCQWLDLREGGPWTRAVQEPSFLCIFAPCKDLVYEALLGTSAADGICE